MGIEAKALIMASQPEMVNVLRVNGTLLDEMRNQSERGPDTADTASIRCNALFPTTLFVLEAAAARTRIIATDLVGGDRLLFDHDSLGEEPLTVLFLELAPLVMFPVDILTLVSGNELHHTCGVVRHSRGDTDNLQPLPG